MSKELIDSFKEHGYLDGDEQGEAIDLLEKQAAEIEELKPLVCDCVTAHHADGKQVTSCGSDQMMRFVEPKAIDNKELRAALVEATGALDKVSATRNIGSAHIVAREALARCKGALK